VLLQEVTEAIISAGSRGLAQYGTKCNDELAKLVELVRGPLTKLQRATCGALVVIDVHARDITIEMSEQGVEDIHDFNWESQLRCAPASFMHFCVRTCFDCVTIF
jgi:dynein heavy chain, axonemal